MCSTRDLNYPYQLQLRLLQHRSESLASSSTSGTLGHLPNSPNLSCILDNISIILVCCEGKITFSGWSLEQLGTENSCTWGAVHPICGDNLKLLSEPNQNITHLLKTTRGPLVHFMWQMNAFRHHLNSQSHCFRILFVIFLHHEHHHLYYLSMFLLCLCCIGLAIQLIRNLHEIIDKLC